MNIFVSALGTALGIQGAVIPGAGRNKVTEPNTTAKRGSVDPNPGPFGGCVPVQMVAANTTAKRAVPLEAWFLSLVL